MHERLVAVPKIADGNPAAAMAWAEATACKIIWLDISTRPVELFHRGISGDPDNALAYTGESEIRRQNLSAKLFSGCSYLELLAKLAFEEGCEQIVQVQEHPLMVASTRQLGRLGVKPLFTI